MFFQWGFLLGNLQPKIICSQFPRCQSFSYQISLHYYYFVSYVFLNGIKFELGREGRRPGSGAGSEGGAASGMSSLSFSSIAVGEAELLEFVVRGNPIRLEQRGNFIVYVWPVGNSTLSTETSLPLDVMFPFDIMTPLPPALLSPISFNVALQQLFNSVSLLLAHQHALVLNLSVSHAPDPAHPMPTQSKSQPEPQSQSYFRSYADALKSSTPSISKSSPRSSFTIRQITPIETIGPHPQRVPIQIHHPSHAKFATYSCI